MTNLEIYKEKFAESGWRVFRRAVSESQHDGSNYVSVEHILFALATDESNIFQIVMSRLGLNGNEVLKVIKERKPQVPQHLGEGVRISADVMSLLRIALDRANIHRGRQIDLNDIFVVLSQDSLSPLNRLLDCFNSSQETLMKVVQENSIPEPQPRHRRARIVRIRSGPYASFTGRVEAECMDQTTLKVALTAFGRTTILEFDRDEVEEISFNR